MVAKVIKDKGGELWLGGLPTEATRDTYGSYNFQVYCFKPHPRDRTTTQQGAGIALAKAQLLHLDMGSPRTMGSQWHEVARTAIVALYRGDTGVVHCMTGVHKAAIASVMLRAVAHRESWEEAKAAVEAVRQVEIDYALAQYPMDIKARAITLITEAQNRLKATIESIMVSGPIAGWGYSTTSIYSQLHLIVEQNTNPGQASSSSSSQAKTQGPLCKWNQQGTSKGAQFNQNITTPSATEAREWGRRLCSLCRNKLPCSLRMAAQSSGLLDI